MCQVSLCKFYLLTWLQIFKNLRSLLPCSFRKTRASTRSVITAKFRTRIWSFFEYFGKSTYFFHSNQTEKEGSRRINLLLLMILKIFVLPKSTVRCKIDILIHYFLGANHQIISFFVCKLMNKSLEKLSAINVTENSALPKTTDLRVFEES